MSGAITISGFGSNMDINSLVSSLMKVESTTLTNLQTRSTLLQSATSTLSGIGSSLSSLQAAADDLSTTSSVNCLKASSSGTAIVATANGAAQPGSYKIEVKSTAKEQKTFSSQQSTSGALGQTGAIQVNVGTGSSAKSGTISVGTNDTLDDIAGKINALGLRASANVVYDGSGYRLQIRGLDTGSDNRLTFTESGTSLDLNGNGLNAAGNVDPAAGNTSQLASNAVIVMDGMQISRPTNQIVGAVTGVTFAVTGETTQPLTVQVAGDSTTLQSKVSTFVSAYNKVISGIHLAAGYGTTKASNDALAGDSALRTVNDRLLRLMSGKSGTGAYQSLADIGISLDRDGVLSVDNTKLTDAISKDASSVSSLLARPQGAKSGGFMADFEDVVKSMTDADSGVLTNRTASLKNEIKDLGDRATKEQTRLDSYEERLRKQFSAMDSSMAASNSLLSSLSGLIKSS